MGAWVEIPEDFKLYDTLESPPVWGRGLKFVQHHKRPVSNYVAPCVGAWVEIILLPLPALPPESPPVWGRGLKWLSYADSHRIILSPPVWGRGLK